MSLTDYTTFAEVRATLGVSALELEDEQLGLPLYDTALSMAFSEVSDVCQSTIDAVRAKLVGDRTADEKRLLAVSGIYASYAIAAILLNTLAMFSYQQVADAKTQVQRSVDRDTVYEGVHTGLRSFKNRLATALLAVEPTAVVSTTTFSIPGLRAVGMATSPITS